MVSMEVSSSVPMLARLPPYGHLSEFQGYGSNYLLRQSQWSRITPKSGPSSEQMAYICLDLFTVLLQLKIWCHQNFEAFAILLIPYSLPWQELFDLLPSLAFFFTLE